jgi:hypothetical protein
MDDIACYSSNFTSHLSLIDLVLHRLETNGFTVNARKCEWAVKETDFLGHCLSLLGIKPWHKNIEAFLNMQAPRNLRQLRTFLGLVTYYRDMGPRRS